jgi:hypothetical protein
MRRRAIRLWAGWWWLLRAHVAARYMIPRGSLEDPPEPWMRVMLDAPRRDAVVPAKQTLITTSSPRAETHAQA